MFQHDVNNKNNSNNNNNNTLIILSPCRLFKDIETNLNET